MAAEFSIHIGTYADSGGPGLVPLAIAPDGGLTPGRPYAAANASFAVFSPRHGLHYLVDEQAGTIGVHRLGADGWHELARVASGGEAPCYLALDAAETRLAVANYASGHAALFALDADGLPRQPPALFRRPGSGPDPKRQEGPHAHCVRFADEALFLIDLGADRIVRLDLNGAGFGETHLAYRAPPGTGPRHLLFAPGGERALLLSELASTLTLLEAREHGLRARQIASTLPAGFKGESLGGHLALNRAGDRVYASNRGHNSLAVFALDRSARRLELLQQVASGGAHPRHFLLDEEHGRLVVAHEKDGRVTLFDLAGDGTLAATGRSAHVPGACFVLG